MGPTGEHRPALGADQVEPARRLAAFVLGLVDVAERAVERRADAPVAGSVVGHPLAELKRRPVPDVLGVPAGEPGDPVAARIPVEAGDRSLHTPKLGPVPRRGGTPWRPSPRGALGDQSPSAARSTLARSAGTDPAPGGSWCSRAHAVASGRAPARRSNSPPRRAWSR